MSRHLLLIFEQCERIKRLSYFLEDAKLEVLSMKEMELKEAEADRMAKVVEEGSDDEQEEEEEEQSDNNESEKEARGKNNGDENNDDDEKGENERKEREEEEEEEEETEAFVKMKIFKRRELVEIFQDETDIKLTGDQIVLFVFFGNLVLWC